MFVRGVVGVCILMNVWVLVVTNISVGSDWREFERLRDVCMCASNLMSGSACVCRVFEP